MHIILPEKEGTTIDTMDGVATYIRTELENARGNWDDNYYVSAGYYIVHDGVNHHIYKAEKKHPYNDGKHLISPRNRYGRMDEPKFEEYLKDVLSGDADAQEIKDISTFQDAGVLTYNHGLQLQMKDGSAFQLKIIRVD